jgi:hypothetical protein
MTVGKFRPVRRPGENGAVTALRVTGRALAWTGVIILLTLMWIWVTLWYGVLVCGGFLIAIPWRIIRRGQRRNRHLQEQQLEALHRLGGAAPQY